ncbi:hypothetical protein EHQ96_06350 [Leptospira levettii]|uniref:Uncharacterized protein n=2 Tax=Leptospira levettii TaxID=2023178 RepID=A0ABY2MS87_9LEPT|nr:hypothetical protein CH381_26650 [Leptospira sp. mixed culture ATI2-C-A1]TGL74262.1 hypothetical protein EHQ60_02725 [Leptospira levettii]TGM25065.1 hypothetical protein EHQ74_16160 [Leptospira levettii]TGM29650.1 hypothetical protein EHQ71_12885 [Leptospira levettii]TGM69160.1 hypothetical protein EHQ96_06350 [Leptospira levettii]
MRLMMVNTLISRLAILLLSFVFISTNTEGYVSHRDTYQKHQTYKHSSLYDFSYVIKEVSENNEEEAEINSHRENELNQTFAFFLKISLIFDTELKPVLFSFPNSFLVKYSFKDRAPPILT